MLLISYRELNEKDNVLLNSGAIHISNTINLKQKQAWLYMVYRAFPNLGKQRMFRMHKADLLKAINYNSFNNEHLKNLLRGLAEYKVEFNIFNKDGSGRWLITHLLASCEIIDEHGIIEYEFSEKLEEKLINPLMYAKLNLLISKKFKSKHALNIYMLAMDYLVLKKNYGEKILSVDELKHYLGLLDKDGNETKKYRVVDIHKHILKRAEKEINELSDINIKIESMKKANSKSISAFKFQMSIKEDHLDFYKPSLNSNHQMNLFNQLDIPGKSQRELKKEKVSIKNPALKKFFADNKISINTTMLQDKLWDIKDSLKAEFEPYLLYLTDYALTESKKGNIKNFASFFVSLLKDDSQIDNYVYYLEQKREKDEQKQIQIENMIEGKLKTQYESYLTLDFKNFLIDNIDELEETFINLFKQKIKSDTMIFNILVGRNKGIINKTLITGFNDFLRAPLIKELQNYKDEFGYIPLEFEEWKQTHINLDDIKNLKKQIECLV